MVRTKNACPNTLWTDRFCLRGLFLVLLPDSEVHNINIFLPKTVDKIIPHVKVDDPEYVENEELDCMIALYTCHGFSLDAATNKEFATLVNTVLIGM